MTRLEAMYEIGKLLDGACGPCQKREELNQLHGRTYSRIDGYCNKQCPVGSRLQALGKQLTDRSGSR